MGGKAGLASLALVAACSGVAGAGRARVALRCDDAEAEVTVDGVPRGRVSDYRGGGGHQLLLAPGQHRLVLRSSSGGSAVRDLSVGPEDQITLGVGLGTGQGAAQPGAEAAGGAR